jgi:hypothetical protein
VCNNGTRDNSVSAGKHFLIKDIFQVSNRLMHMFHIFLLDRNLLSVVSHMSVTSYVADKPTNSTEPSPSYEATSYSVNRAIPSILWNSKVRHHIHKIPPFVPILTEINKLHASHSSLIRILISYSHLCLYIHFSLSWISPHRIKCTALEITDPLISLDIHHIQKYFK